MDYIYIIILAGIFLLFVSFYFLFKNKETSSSSFQPKKLLTDNEFEFFQRLIKACPNYFICPQVSMGALLNSASSDYEKEKQLRYSFGYKIVDFVIYSQEKKVIAIVELDDRTHDKEKDYKRDLMLREAGYKILRFESKRKPKIQELSNIIRNL